MTAACASAVALALLMSTTAEAVPWNSSSNPLTVTGYGSTGEGYGSFYISTGSSGTRYKFRVRQRIDNADNHQVYANLEYWSNTGICLAPAFFSCNAPYQKHATDVTDRTTKSSYVTLYESAPIDPYASFHRGRVRMRLDIPWRFDPASGWTVTEGIQY